MGATDCCVGATDCCVGVTDCCVGATDCCVGATDCCVGATDCCVGAAVLVPLTAVLVPLAAVWNSPVSASVSTCRYASPLLKTVYMVRNREGLCGSPIASCWRVETQFTSHMVTFLSWGAANSHLVGVKLTPFALSCTNLQHQLLTPELDLVTAVLLGRGLGILPGQRGDCVDRPL